MRSCGSGALCSGAVRMLSESQVDRREQVLSIQGLAKTARYVHLLSYGGKSSFLIRFFRVEGVASRTQPLR